MLRLEQHGPVVRAEFFTARTRLIGISVSCYLHKGVVVDTAFPDVRAEFRGWLSASRPIGVVVTHQHEDHAGNVNSVAKLGVPAWIAPETFAALARVKPIGLYRRFAFQSMRSLTRSVEPFDGGALQAVATPGHSSDHHVAWDPEEEILFAGDLFLGSKVRVAHANEDPRALVRSLRAMAALRPRLMFCAHRGMVPEPSAALSSKADWLEHTIGEVDRLLDAGWTKAATARAVLGRGDRAAYFSFGDYSQANLVTAIRDSRSGVAVSARREV